MKEVKNLCDVCPHNKGAYKTCYDGMDCHDGANEVVSKLYKEISELKDEVETLKSERTYKFYLGNDKVQDFKVSEMVHKMIRTQICEKIRDEQSVFTYKYDGIHGFLELEFNSVLDEIEEGGA